MSKKIVAIDLEQAQKESDMVHIDDFIDDFIKRKTPGEKYARWIFLHFRLPAVLQIDFGPFMKEHKLFCTYKGERYRCIGASRLGDIWLTKNFEAESGYDLRPAVNDCSDWGPSPDIIL